ncbi:hypothetical protein KY290_034208 [Solanum tuberosum]|uniref:Uncharacterized protein n=1 Tax=Solanum tuberosum TaxID=4113 RepID=A0ABQ7U301_SOLTU|nr:hypothetical protein KY289_033591 [Solanum tuberosum]KAH0648242.1 hypothetical protein KY285_033490 [Solanum tuberosum]KAH0741165.1 hypothetical protein KY290_034208 [Solanum tuberosum]
MEKVLRKIYGKLKSLINGQPYQEEEADIEVLETNDMFFESSEAPKKSIEEMIREYSSRLCVGVATSQEIDSVSLDKIIVEKLRERESLRTQQGDNLHGLTDDEESLSFEEARGVRKKLPRFLPRCGSKLRLSSSTTSVG